MAFRWLLLLFGLVALSKAATTPEPIIDDCSSFQCDPNADCTDTYPGFECSCRHGYTGDGFVCIDINECADPENPPCDVNADCQNLQGGFECHCKTGYQGDGMICDAINDCSSSQCDPNANCTNTNPGFHCNCRDGFTGDGFLCTDINECADPANTPCDVNAHCQNLEGSFKCHCKTGYNGDGMICEEIDPCIGNTCSNDTYCYKLQSTEEAGPSYQCIAFGYQPGECSVHQYYTCHEHATCIESEDALSFTCVCKEGTEGDGFKDGKGCSFTFKPCALDTDCPQYGFCNSTTHRCECDAGFDGDGFNCTDHIDCPSDECDPHAICTDFPGGFTCVCDGQNNYQGDGRTCQLVCLSDNDCYLHAKCNASDVCECVEGYVGNGAECLDIDECLNNTHNCDPNADCTNTDGSFECVCRNGYDGDGVRCQKLPRSCDEISDIQVDKLYRIDPDFEGPGKALEVNCEVVNGVTLTKMHPLTPFPIPTRNSEETEKIFVDYGVDKEDIVKLVEHSEYCYQNVEFGCLAGFALFPGTTWYDAYGVGHENWGSTLDQTCACGQVGSCPNKCMCDGTTTDFMTFESAKIVDKTMLPVKSVWFNSTTINKGRLTVKELVCASKQTDLPKDCHEAKFQYDIKKNGPLYIDVDGDGGQPPFLVYCDMESYTHVGITELKPSQSSVSESEESIEYHVEQSKIQALLTASVYCSQKVELTCKNSRVLNGYGAVYSPSGELPYFPGANGEQGTCACGATESCAKAEVKCNCDIMDGETRKDFGLVVDKSDLPIVKFTAETGEGKEASYVIGSLQCAQKQFGIEPNCEKYRAIGQAEDYSYLIDPDGPGGVNPFVVECQFSQHPPQGTTIIHHKKEEMFAVFGPDWLPQYLQADYDQMEALKKRSTFCTQQVTMKCREFKLHLSGNGIKWSGAVADSLNLTKGFDTCDMDGVNCNCDQLPDGTDTGYLTDMENLPARAINFNNVLSQTEGGSLDIQVGPMVCSEIFPTCAVLKQFIDSGRAVEGEADVIDGKFTIDPDGPGGAEPFEVLCRFPATVVYLKGGNDKLEPDPYNPFEPLEQCFDAKYYTEYGAEISPAQIHALVQTSGKCSQKLDLFCLNAPATGHVNFTTCDGVTQTGWAGSQGYNSCACGVAGICDGGPESLCNCDMADDTDRTDGGMIIQTERLPICEVCLRLDGSADTGVGVPPVKWLQYKVGQLTCDGVTYTKTSCQAARQNEESVSSEELVTVPVPVGGNAFPVPAACRFYEYPPIGELLIVPKEPVYPPETTESDMDVVISYVTYDLDLINKVITKNGYCSQVLFVFCGGDGPILLGLDNNAWYDVKGEMQLEWVEVPEESEKIDKACNDHPEMCQQCGKPRAFQVIDKTLLPITRVTLNVQGATLVVDSVSCMKLHQSCQDVVDDRTNRYMGFIQDNKYVIDPDGPGDLFPFVVLCDLDFRRRIGVTEIPVTGDWKGKVVNNGTEPMRVQIPVEYEEATPEQVESLTEVSEFCWQNVKYECKSSPVTDNGELLTSYELYNGGVASTFGTGPANDTVQCACGVTGTCIDGGSCNCDAMGTAVDQGAVTDKDALPITSVTVGGQTLGVSEAKITVTNIRCAKKPFDPPSDCAEAMTKGFAYGVDYSLDSEYLISPSPTTGVEPFMVHCDFTTFPDKGVTVVKSYIEEPNVPTHEPESSKTTIVSYRGPDPEQIRELIRKSAYCYQGVKYDCYQSAMFAEGSYWQTVGDTMETKRTFWGGGDPATGTCACGAEQNCGGLDSQDGQMSRKCNCDAVDGVYRSDAGIITNKELLPIGSFSFGPSSTLGEVTFTIGDLYCSQEPLEFNECALGFHDCHSKADCIDTPEGYKCVCQEGWRGKDSQLHRQAPRANGRECIDDNECSWNPCPYSATCHNLPGTFNCTCNPGYRQINALECQDINECADPALNDCNANARCENLDGSYRCICKRGFRGDGRECIPVGLCACFGDPHCLSYDDRWLHFMGECQYVMSQDGCGADQSQQTFRVEIDNWKKDLGTQGYYSWVKQVRVVIHGREVILGQGNTIMVDGMAVTQYSDLNLLNVFQQGPKTVLQSATGLEVSFDGNDIVEVTVPHTAHNNTCGFCGNYDGNSDNDWIMGPTCEGTQGKLTEKEYQFGQSWTVVNQEETCDIDCSRVDPPGPEDSCRYPIALVEDKCDKLFDPTISPFKDCLVLLSETDLSNLRQACITDACYSPGALSTQMCTFAGSIASLCTLKENVKSEGWRQKVDFCEAPSCPENQEYKACGPLNPPTCGSTAVNSLYAESCNEGCFCPEGTVMEGDQCIKPEECGCVYENTYIPIGQQKLLSGCKHTVKCVSYNNTELIPTECSNLEECGLEQGLVQCLCRKGYIREERTNLCIPDICYDVNCTVPNAECVNGTCMCKKGYIGDCSVCEDIDECAVGEGHCPHVGEECVNTQGSFICQCGKGFIQSEDFCEDIDECAYGLDDCAEGAQCVNTRGGYRCECCVGYRLKEGSTTQCESDGTTNNGNKCCACTSEKCDEPGMVCGTDGVTYSNFRALFVTACRNDDPDLKVNYEGPCQNDCGSVQCSQQYATCELINGVPTCVCPTCPPDTNLTSIEEMVCATNKITYINKCHMMEHACQVNFETKVEVEVIGKPCPGNGVPLFPSQWSEWGECSEKCKQGVMNRTRDTHGLNIPAVQTMPCFSTCEQGPCTMTTCSGPGEVCTVDDNNVTKCECPVCIDHPSSPVCGRIGAVIQTFDNECELKNQVCQAGQSDYEVLEEMACEEKPKMCGRVHRYMIPKDENGCVADRSLDLGLCYGGCDDVGDLCCEAAMTGKELAVVTCPDGSRHNKWFDTIETCDCVNPPQKEDLSMQIVP